MGKSKKPGEEKTAGKTGNRGKKKGPGDKTGPAPKPGAGKKKKSPGTPTRQKNTEVRKIGVSTGPYPGVPADEKPSIPGFERLERIESGLKKLDAYADEPRESAAGSSGGKKGRSPATILEHIDAFRSRIITLLVLLILFTIAGFVFSDTLLEIMNRPFVSSGHKLNIFNITEAFLIRVKLSFAAAVFVLFPFIVYQVWNLITRRLPLKSKTFFLISLLSAILLFYTGVAFTYFLILPASIDILLSFVSEEMFSTIGAADYINFILVFSIILGVLFDFPVIAMLLTKIGLVTPQFLSKYRRHAIVIIWIIAAVVTPTPDPFNQSVVAVPLMIFYEISIIGAKIIVRKKNRELS